MSEESLIHCRSHRKEQHTVDAVIPYISSINLPVITLWYLKRYHSDWYISIEINLGRLTINYFTVLCLSKNNFITCQYG